LPDTFPIVAFNRAIEVSGCGAVLTENEKGARTAVEYLISRGHTKIGAIVGSGGLMTSRERLKGFQKAMAAAQLPIESKWLATGGVKAESGRIGAMKVLMSPERPTAVLTSSHRITEGVLRALKELGLRYGHDVEIVSFDNMPWMAFLEPPLPVIEQPTHRIGREAMQMLAGIIKGTGRPSVVRLPTRLVTHTEGELRIAE
jgi:LacI family transcriptional regulator